MEEDIYKYEIGIITNEDRDTKAVTNNEQDAISIFSSLVEDNKNNRDDHIIIFIFDYDKNTNIRYYDNQTEIS